MCHGGITRARTLDLIFVANFFASSKVMSDIGPIEFG